MSKENVISFLNLAKQDAELQHQLKEIEQANDGVPVSELIRLANDKGLGFTLEDFQETKAQQSELSNDQLDKVVGGEFYWGWPNKIIDDPSLPSIETS